MFSIAKTVPTFKDLGVLYRLLEQSKGKGLNVYTHGEMLPAHSYPKLKEFAHLKGHYGTHWGNQQKEFRYFPGSILMTPGGRVRR
eukprot:Skav217764  [mRNA]  locus=scaffold1912:22533:25427:- [translate_table: standard]